ncbi:S-adenosyl-L-methionine-dependent tRNA 4-demethylwyosine synthase [Erysiphe neolycopersici]|uniref:tRNA 4-demethylwyosine synthase (AdoMet-dependent) n=1 Tax=Erysiphe neolycopersici TaxID=212602 RepID=A0A420HTL8_9PEZI|nr:S-adenosyl-L-methionine-dependent tRNA 4-demethylwyosine synthase [Erysiphe neolycopersici]
MSSVVFGFRNLLWPAKTKNPVELWHYHRTSIILTAFTVFIAIKVLVYLRAARKKHSDYNSSIAEQHLVPSPEKKENVFDVQAFRSGKTPRRIVGGLKKSLVTQNSNLSCQKIKPFVFFSSLTGTTKSTAETFVDGLITGLGKLETSQTRSFLIPELLDISNIDFYDYFLKFPNDEDAETRNFYLFLIPTYNIDTILDNLIEHMRDIHNDFRINTAPLSSILGYSVFGFGDREGWPTEELGFCSQARDIDKWMAKLTGGKRAFPLGMGDRKIDGKENLEKWKEGIEEVFRQIASTGNLGEGVVGSGDADESDYEASDADQSSVNRLESSRKKSKTQSKKYDQNDLEDIGRSLNMNSSDNAPQEVDFTTYSTKLPLITKEMVPQDSPTYAALTKQGYTIVGSHSGVKICRWTKSALRGRGSCYKYSFYGIASHQCMETTPSLSCSNKCVFCWRHGTNPVGTTWRWRVDPPELIYDGVKASHYQKIKMMRGVPGVRAERFTEAMNIRHCALSLVGEPIFYPHINEFTDMLHADHISTFLVCNAQHPDQLLSLKPVTQLYVSIDASNRESLRKIDRPLHRDFWERFNRCLDILRDRRFEQRTVFRLTLTKGFNMEDEVVGYADLIEKSLPCFIEIKGVTYCGNTSSKTGAGLTMQNVPFYDEVCFFVQELDRELSRRDLNYGIAAEHAHSCCVLIASKRFQLNGKWHTRIDYDQFFRCLESGKKFGPEDYIGLETPEWATWGRGGFDPRDERVYRKGKNKVPSSLAIKPELE